MATVIEILLSGGHGEGLQAEGDGREEHAQPLPEKHVWPHRGDKEPESLYEPVRAHDAYDHSNDDHVFSVQE